VIVMVIANEKFDKKFERKRQKQRKSQENWYSIKICGALNFEEKYEG
jgi:hypothetical protein